jgi:hypothetical protein
MLCVYWSAGDVIPGARVLLIALAKASARTGAPLLKRKPVRSLNVHVFRLCDARGYAAATSGTRRKPAGAALSGYVMSRAQVVSSSARDSAEYARAGSR